MAAPLLPYLLIGTVLGVAVVALSVRVLVLPIAALVAAFMFISPRVAYFTLVATIPVYFGFASGSRYQMAVSLPILFIMVVNACARRAPWPIVVRWPEGYLAVAFCIAVAASLWRTPDPFFSALAIVGVYAPMAFIFFATLAFVRDRAELETVLWVLVGVGIVESILAIIESRFDIVFSVMLVQARASGMVDLDGGLGVLATTWHPSILGAFLTMTVAIALYQSLRASGGLARLGTLAGAALMLYAIYLTYSRLAFLSLFVSLAIAVLATSKVARYAASLLGLVFVALLASRDFSLASLVHDFEQTLIPDALRREGALFNSAWYALMYRFETWGIAWNMFLSDPLLGVGMGQTASGWTPDFLPTWATTWGPLTTPEEPNAGITHNAFLGILAEHGIFAFLSFVGLWAWAIRSLASASKHAELRPYAVLLGAILAGQLVFLLMHPISRDFSLTLALAIVLGRMLVTKTVSPGAPEHDRSSLKARPASA